MPITVNDKALYDLEWDRIVDALASYSQTLRGRASCLSLTFYDTLADATTAQRRVAEFRSLIEKDEAPSLAGVSSSVSDFVVKAKKDGILDIGELIETAKTISVANRISETVGRRQNDMPELADLCAGITPITKASDAIKYAIDMDQGELLDRASESLGSLRKRVRNLHQRVKHKLDDILSDKSTQQLLRDTYYTIREDRYVLPVRASEKSRFKGIVHGASGSGQTIFIEPREMVQINNDLALAQMEVEREIRQILRGLSRMVAEEGDFLTRNIRVLTQLDVVQATAQLAQSLDAVEPKMVDDSLFDIRQARHPLLVMKGIEVVSNDLGLGDKFNVLVMSGANTGGKTVALKTIGLCVLMAWAGIPIPAAEPSTIGRFDTIQTVIGDEQSLSDDLSTFSANILSLNHVVKECTPHSLILLDEIVVGTDPRQGAALAQSIVEAMADRQARLVVTTHYEALKRLAHLRDDFMNAAVALSTETLKPSYRITLGIPGASAAFRIAEELGVVPSVIARANALMEDKKDDLDALVARLQEDIEKQHEEVKRLEAAKTELEKARETYEERLQAVERREKQDILIRKKDVLEEISKAKELVRDAIRRIQKGDSMPDATAAMADLKEMEDKFQKSVDDTGPVESENKPATKTPKRKPLSYEELVAGLEVYVANLEQKGVIVQAPDKRGTALVEVGRLKMRIPAERLQALFKHESVQPPQQKSKKLKTALAESNAPSGSRDASLTCDLRGERVDEALDHVDAFLDRAVRANAPFVYFIHGHGTGRLKSALREHFRASPYVRSFRPGERGEGQDGVTVVMLSE